MKPFSSVSLLALSLIATSALAQSSGGIELLIPQMPPAWIKVTNQDCKVWNPDPRPNETATWSGQCKEGYVSGQGVLQWFENGQRDTEFDGIYINGKRNGFGVIILPGGQHIQAVWINDEPRPAENVI